MSTIDPEWFAAPTLEVARALIGVTIDFADCAGVIVETEAYTDDDASHFVTRRPSAGELMGTTYGRIYIYRIYGVHHCFNITTDARGPGAVLIRALEPTVGIAHMRRRRGVDTIEALCSGPGKLCQAVGLDPALSREPVTRHMMMSAPAEPIEVQSGPRIGIRAATDLPWRFGHAGSRFLSRPMGTTTRRTMAETSGPSRRRPRSE